jgi:Protein of unknown function (DUF3102)
MPKAITESPVELLAKAEEMRKKAEQSFGEYALQAGMYLIQAKAKIAHGQWQEHVEKYTGFSLRTAEVYMRARRRYNGMPAGEQRSVLEQPFTRSLLVLTAQPKGKRGAPSTTATPTALPEPQSQVIRQVEDFLDGRRQTTDERLDQSRATTALVDSALEYSYIPEATPMDDILDGPQKTYTDEFPSAQEISAEQQEQFDAALAEVERLERQNRELTRELAEARQNGGSQRQMRGWDFVEALHQYLRADEPQRTPESLARRASTVPDGAATISYLEMFFSSARQHLAVMA